jgi:hypothetical protein
MATNREIMEKFLQFINTGDAAIDRPIMVILSVLCILLAGVTLFHS